MEAVVGRWPRPNAGPSWPALAAVVWGLLLGHAALLGDVAPLGLAYTAAVRRADPARAAWAALGVSVGTFLRVPAAAPLTAVLAFALLLAIGALEDRAPSHRDRIGVVLVAVACAIAGLMPESVPLEAPVTALLDAVVGAALFLPFHAGVRFAAGRPPVRLALDSADGAGLVLLVGGALASVAPVSVSGVALGAFLAPLAAQAAARVAGAGAGAVTGLGVGGLLVLAGGLGPAGALMAAAGAVLAAWGRRLGSAWAALGALSGALLFARGLGPSPHALLGGLAAFVVATAGVWLAPTAVFELGASYVGLTPARPDRALRRRLREISRVVGILSTAVGEQAAAGRNGRNGRPGRDAGAGLPVDRLMQGVTRRACAGCGRFAQCWQRDVSATYARLNDDLAHFAAPESQAALESSLRAWCLRPKAVAVALGYVRDLFEVETRLVRRWRATRSALAEPLRGVSEMLGQVERVPADEEPPEALAFAWGMASRARGGAAGAVSGDACLVRMLPGRRLLVALSDGMGVGAAAAVESEPTVRLADRLLGTGFGVRTAAQTVNSLMVLEGAEDTFATLDLAVVRLDSGEAEFVKIGAPPTLLVRRGRIDRVEVHAPPSGILHDLAVDVRHRRLSAGDWLVAMTDGAYDALRPDDDWLEGFLRALDRARGPQWVADQLLARAVAAAGDGMDDATVAVVRLGPGPGAGA